jgi:hypothetical protein
MGTFLQEVIVKMSEDFRNYSVIGLQGRQEA